MKRGITFLSVIALLSLGLFIGFSNTGDQPNGSRSGISSFDTPPVVNISPFSALKFSDSLNGANDTTALKNRGYKPYYRGTGPQGLTATWFQPAAAPPFPAFNGPTTGYAAANFNVVTGTNNIDSWLVLPALNIATGDTLSFYSNSTGSTWVDSVTVSYSAAGDSVPEAGSWVMLGKFKVNAGWALNNYMAPAGGPNARFAIRYKVVNGGPNGANSDYMGVDMITVRGSVAPPVSCGYTYTAQTSGTTAPLQTVKSVSNMIGWAAGNTQTVRRTTDGGTTWTNANPNPGVITGDVYNIEALDANTAWVTSSPGSTFIYKTTNGGTNWVQVYTAPTPSFINAIKMVTPLNGYAFGDPVGGNWVILTTVDGGTTWVPLATAPPGTGDGRNNSVRVSLPNIWFGTGQGTVVRSTNAGVTWTTVPTTSLAGQVLTLQFEGSIGLAGGATMVRSTDGGSTYAAVTALGTGNIFGLQSSGTDFWYARGTGIYRSTDAGLTFTLAFTGAGAYSDMSLSSSSGCMTGWAVGAAGLVSKINGLPTAIGDPSFETPDAYMLSQNYPNPFNPSTTIRYSIPSNSMVTLKVYDMVGKEVATLVNEIKNVGIYSVDFNASFLSSGVYFYSIQAGDFKQVKRMMLVK